MEISPKTDPDFRAVNCDLKSAYPICVQHNGKRYSASDTSTRSPMTIPLTTPSLHTRGKTPVRTPGKSKSYNHKLNGKLKIHKT